jgi:ribosomal protein S18 acetylase RimI-like enzyme
MSNTPSDAVVIRRAGADAIAMLQPLWTSLHDHHLSIAPHLQELGPPRPAEQSWAVRAALYEQWLAEPDAFVILAETDRTPVGYALVHLRGEEESWQTGPRIAELESLAVLPGHRAHGIGGQLIEAVYAELTRLGVDQLGVSVISTNTAAIRFYERLGLLPFCVSYIGSILQYAREGNPGAQSPQPSP